MHRNSNKHNELGWNETGEPGRVVGSWYGCALSSTFTVGVRSGRAGLRGGNGPGERRIFFLFVPRSTILYHVSESKTRRPKRDVRSVNQDGINRSETREGVFERFKKPVVLLTPKTRARQLACCSLSLRTKLNGESRRRTDIGDQGEEKQDRNHVNHGHGDHGNHQSVEQKQAKATKRESRANLTAIAESDHRP
jgi:hypothetical protein